MPNWNFPLVSYFPFYLKNWNLPPYFHKLKKHYPKHSNSSTQSTFFKSFMNIKKTETIKMILSVETSEQMLKLFYYFRISILVLFVCCISTNGQQPSGPISLGSSITAGTNSSWKSPSGEFAFGFASVARNLFLVAVWFDSIPEETLVWSANQNSPAESGSTVQLTRSGQLLLTYSNGSQQQITSGNPVTSGLMQDDGNFVLKDSDFNTIWESFSSPTDTILPGQVLLTTRSMFSRNGKYRLEMQSDGNLVLSTYYIAEPGYWRAGILQQLASVNLAFNQSDGGLYLVNNTGHRIYSIAAGNISNPVEDFYHRATINDEGDFVLQVFDKRNGSVGWTRVWRAVPERCLVPGICGVNGMCTSADNETVSCSCIPGYIALDGVGDVSRGCHPETVVSYCGPDASGNLTVEVLDDADFYSEGFANLGRVENVDVEGCKKALMDDCYSLAASLVGSTCYKKRMPLLKARRRTASSRGIKALIKVPRNDASRSITEGNYKKDGRNVRKILIIGLIANAVLALIFGGAAMFYHPGVWRLVGRKGVLDLDAIGVGFREFTFQELREATSGFSNVLGQGSSAKVYRGMLSLKGVPVQIAVKKLEKEIESSSEAEFITELKIIGRTHHKNLVRLQGFCIENHQRLLVYKLMENGTLSSSIFGKQREQRPRWSQRAEMVLGIAKGLQYLHEECETQIIHCDIKPQNVLLDEAYTAKIADFGLSKLLNKNQTKTDTVLRGTMGYMAPEWLRNAPVTTKVDVHSFGVVLLETVCCRRHIELSRVEEESEADDLVLSDWVINSMLARKLEIVVGNDPEVMSDFERFRRMVVVGLWCMSPDPGLRPSMKEVVRMLEGTTDVGVPPLLSHHLLLRDHQVTTS